VHLELEESFASHATAEKMIAEPEDVAWIMSFLASPESGWIKGNSVEANGGAVLDAQGEEEWKLEDMIFDRYRYKSLTLSSSIVGQNLWEVNHLAKYRKNLLFRP
jgi:hypothetical protein